MDYLLLKRTYLVYLVFTRNMLSVLRNKKKKKNKHVKTIVKVAIDTFLWYII